jgi:hypothetical protein
MAGLLNIFDPGYYGGSMQGLLANLPGYQAQPGPSQGFPGMPTDMSSQSRAPAMPMQIGPQMPDAGPQMPQQQMPQQGGGFFDRLGAGLGANSNTLLAMGASLLGGQGFGGAAQAAMGGRAMDQKQRGANATKQALMAKGVSPDLAEAAAANPELAKALIPQLFGGRAGVTINDRLVDPITGKLIADFSDTSKKAPSTTTIENPDGTKTTLEWSPQGWKPIGPGPAGAPAAAAAGAVTPSPIPPAPPGVNVPAYRKEMAESTVKDLGSVRDKAKGAIEFLQRAERAKATNTGAGDDLFGPIQGTEAWNTFVRTPVAAVTGDLVDANKNTQKFSELKSQYKDLSSSLLKARFGSAQLSNADLAAAEALVGGLSSADAASANKVLDNLAEEARDRVRDAVKAGIMSEQEAAQYLQTKPVAPPAPKPGAAPAGTTKSGLKWSVQ